ncbi:hypothetical protein OH77DRAFT_66549 [Trametes cingulata]|nr:hypothetical protein OH77DRAFT_66549 [Trametes cingulata]
MLSTSASAKSASYADAKLHRSSDSTERLPRVSGASTPGCECHAWVHCTVPSKARPDSDAIGLRVPHIHSLLQCPVPLPARARASYQLLYPLLASSPSYPASRSLCLTRSAPAPPSHGNSVHAKCKPNRRLARLRSNSAAGVSLSLSPNVYGPRANTTRDIPIPFARPIRVPPDIRSRSMRTQVHTRVQ